MCYQHLSPGSRWRTFLWGLFLLAFTAFAGAQERMYVEEIAVDSNATAKQEYRQLRGLEKDRKDYTTPFRTAANVLLFVPRTIFSGVLYTTGYGPHLIDDSDFIEKFDDFFYLYQKEIGWYPVFDFSSGSPLAYGATVFYRQKPFGISAGGYYANQSLWKAKIRLLEAFRIGHSVLQLNLSGSILTRDDYKFHGFGADPENDRRNSFRPDRNDDFGIYQQRLSRVLLVIGLRPSARWQFFYTGYYQERKIESPGSQDPDNIGNAFDINNIPGLSAGKPNIGKQVYNEISVRFDTRRYRGQISPGVRLEGYVGLSEGVGSDESRFTRAGGNAALFLPVIKHNRLIVPRVVFDMIDNRNDDVPISFAEYPRQPTFRGASRKRLLRTDEISVVPSFEYQWPLTFNVGGHLFVDYLLVSNSIDKLTFRKAPYAIGFGFDVHSEDSELARFTFSGGSEGLRFQFTVGLSGYSTDRSRWQ